MPVETDQHSEVKIFEENAKHGVLFVLFLRVTLPVTAGCASLALAFLVQSFGSAQWVGFIFWSAVFVFFAYLTVKAWKKTWSY